MGLMRDIDKLNQNLSYWHTMQTAKNTRRIANALDGGGQSYFGGDQNQILNFTVDKDGTARGSSGMMIAVPDGAKLVATVTRVIVEAS